MALSDSRLSNRDRSLIQTAIKLASRSECNYRHGAIVYKSGRVLSMGVNSYRNKASDTVDEYGISVHAEIAAIRRVSPDLLRGSTVYVARIKKCDEHGMSKPCPRCHEALVDAGVKRVVFTD